MELKNIDDFINESYNADYLAAIINKLKSEGKSSTMIFTYLDLLNIPKERIMQSMADCGCITEESITESELDDIVNDIDDEAEDEKVESEKESEKEPEEEPEEESKPSQSDKQDALKDVINNVELLAKGVKTIKKIVSNTDDEESEESM